MERNNINNITSFVKEMNLSREEERLLWIGEVNRLLSSYEALNNLVDHVINWESEHHFGYFGSFEKRNNVDQTDFRELFKKAIDTYPVIRDNATLRQELKEYHNDK